MVPPVLRPASTSRSVVLPAPEEPIRAVIFAKSATNQPINQPTNRAGDREEGGDATATGSSGAIGAVPRRWIGCVRDRGAANRSTGARHRCRYVKTRRDRVSSFASSAVMLEPDHTRRDHKDPPRNPSPCLLWETIRAAQRLAKGRPGRDAGRAPDPLMPQSSETTT